jgi:hypothetical protein
MHPKSVELASQRPSVYASSAQRASRGVPWRKAVVDETDEDRRDNELRPSHVWRWKDFEALYHYNRPAMHALDRTQGEVPAIKH